MKELDCTQTELGPKRLVIVDGTSKAGKGTLSGKLADCYEGSTVIDSGKYFRLFSIVAGKLGISPDTDDTASISAVVDKIIAETIPNHPTLEDLTETERDELIGSQEGGHLGSVYGVNALVRFALQELTDDLVLTAPKAGLIIYDGRAEYNRLRSVEAFMGKLALALHASASLETKVFRTLMNSPLHGPNYLQARKEILARDFRDTNRAIDPSVTALDALQFNVGAGLDGAVKHQLARSGQLCLDTSNLKPDDYVQILRPLIVYGSNT